MRYILYFVYDHHNHPYNNTRLVYTKYCTKTLYEWDDLNYSITIIYPNIYSILFRRDKLVNVKDIFKELL